MYGTLTHTNNTATSTNALGQWVPNGRVFVICSNLLVDTAGSIIADALGYAGSPTNTIPNGYGPGGGGETSGKGGGGGGYGGLGGNNNVSSGAGPTYGVASAPDQPGSGGGGEYIGGQTGPGGAGGGLIWIQATQGTVTVNGKVSANGAYPTLGTLQRCGAGSGGGIYIRCSTFAGANGTLSAVGGWSGQFFPGGGGGGRIAIVVDTNAQAIAPPVSVQFRCGGGFGQNGGFNGAPGTIYVNSSQVLPTVWTGTVANAVLQGFSSWAPAQLAITNSVLSFLSRVQLSVSNDFSLACTTNSAGLILTNASSLTCGGNLSLSNSAVYLYPDVDTTVPTLTVNGNLSLASTGTLYVYAAMTNSTSPTGACVNVAGAMSLVNGSFVYPYCNPTNGGGVAFTVGSLSIADATSGFNADGKGYAGSPNGVTTNGYGPGGGGTTAGGGGGGGGYGGLGGNNNASTGAGSTYGVASAPYQPGSGGGGSSSGTSAGGAGGGLIWIQATQGAVTVNGRISANGTFLTSALGGNRAGGGSGGGIYIACSIFAGTNGTVSAAGGWAGQSFPGGGGGGRIAIVVDTNAQASASPVSVQFQCGGGLGQSGGFNGTPGTVYVTSSQILPTVWTNGGGVLQGFSSWAPTQLAITNSQLSFFSRVQLNVSNDISLAGTTNNPATLLTLTNASSFSCGGNMSISNAALYSYPDVDTTMPTLVVNGNVSLVNTGRLYVFAAMTNATSPTGAWVNVGGVLSLTNGSAVYPYSNATNGGSVYFTVKDLSLNDTSSGFNADAKGYQGAPAGVTTNGFGPGGGRATTSAGAGGGGYGGAGGYGGTTTNGGLAYGASNSPPVYAGSGGGTHSDGLGAGGNGGGLIAILASGTITLNGYLTANGVTTGTQREGGGSGGGIYLKCRTIQGTAGSLSANGSIGCNYGGGGGGGGRIQVWAAYNNLPGGTLPAFVLPGTTNSNPGTSQSGSTGTVYWGTFTLSLGSIFSVR